MWARRAAPARRRGAEVLRQLSFSPKKIEDFTPPRTCTFLNNAVASGPCNTRASRSSFSKRCKLYLNLQVHGVVLLCAIRNVSEGPRVADERRLPADAALPPRHPRRRPRREPRLLRRAARLPCVLSRADEQQRATEPTSLTAPEPPFRPLPPPAASRALQRRGARARPGSTTASLATRWCATLSRRRTAVSTTLTTSTRTRSRCRTSVSCSPPSSSTRSPRASRRPACPSSWRLTCASRASPANNGCVHDGRAAVHVRVAGRNACTPASEALQFQHSLTARLLPPIPISPPQTMFFKDPAGNNLEFKAMSTPANLFAKYVVTETK